MVFSSYLFDPRLLKKLLSKQQFNNNSVQLFDSLFFYTSTKQVSCVFYSVTHGIWKRKREDQNNDFIEQKHNRGIPDTPVVEASWRNLHVTKGHWKGRRNCKRNNNWGYRSRALKNYKESVDWQSWLTRHRIHARCYDSIRDV